eukprot:727249-Hanusia_phi.AAC.7
MKCGELDHCSFTTSCGTTDLSSISSCSLSRSLTYTCLPLAPSDSSSSLLSSPLLSSPPRAPSSPLEFKLNGKILTVTFRFLYRTVSTWQAKFLNSELRNSVRTHRTAGTGGWQPGSGRAARPQPRRVRRPGSDSARPPEPRRLAWPGPLPGVRPAGPPGSKPARPATARAGQALLRVMINGSS